MAQEFIQFKRQRELGEILSATFKFLRENYRIFFKLLFRIAAPVFILLFAALTYYNYSTQEMPLQNTIFNQRGDFIISFGVLILALLVYYAMLHGIVYNLIKSYIKNKGHIDEVEVAAGAKADFGKLIGFGAISWLMIFAGTILFVIPGIYLSVPLSITAAILVFRNKGISEGISESFNLIKDNWWMSFITILCIWLIVYVISFVFQLPFVIYMMVKAFTVVQQGSAASGDSFDWVYLALSILGSLVQYILYSIIPICLAFLYFHLNEKKNFTGTYETIENLGKHD
ncbi:hypothetical protein [Salegentibacter chungangensis]|uniref:Glycerophosphoryl diester phosphodiesterase membrane domain-containing protein n=1 Tax=Salegentibacter chungangensis TaxID=1335724 RepID=A0ABW3NTP1_9FLAO